MDPYQTLGVPIGCTRDELKNAFRAKARLAHPDRGGDPAAFIRLREAFEQISNELKRKPVDPIAEKPEQPTRYERRPKPPDPNWNPELIVRDEPLPRRRPGGPRDPNWKPDVILVDEGPPPGPLPASPDPKHGRVNYIGWLRGFLVRTPPKDPDTRTAGWNASGIMALLVAIFLTVWICWAAWRYETPAKNPGIETKYDPTRATP